MILFIILGICLVGLTSIIAILLNQNRLINSIQLKNEEILQNVKVAIKEQINAKMNEQKKDLQEMEKEIINSTVSQKNLINSIQLKNEEILQNVKVAIEEQINAKMNEQKKDLQDMEKRIIYSTVSQKNIIQIIEEKFKNSHEKIDGQEAILFKIQKDSIENLSQINEENHKQLITIKKDISQTLSETNDRIKKELIQIKDSFHDKLENITTTSINILEENSKENIKALENLKNTITELLEKPLDW